jgi:Histidine kinase-, DNA gyrase B-, and HSP90-like ATPase
MLPQSSTNLRNRVTKLHLPKTKPLLPLFEIISNSIHAIEERKTLHDGSFDGEIVITTLRNGNEEILHSFSEIDSYPIHSFQIYDNGIGLDEDNMKSFAEFDSDRKSVIGGKGIGRLVCLKAFQKIIVESVYKTSNEYNLRKFEYKKSKEGFDKYEDKLKTVKINSETIVTLSRYEDDFIKHVPLNLEEIARQIVTHFQLYFIQGKEPKITIKNQNNQQINLTDLFNAEFEKEILEDNFLITDNKFFVYISKAYNAKSHKIHYCAHERIVKDEGLSKYLADLKFSIKEDENSEGYYFQVFVVGDFLNNNVNDERTGFSFAIEDEADEIDSFKEVTLSKIRKGTIQCIENKLSDFLEKVRKEKLDKYLPIIEKEYPNYYSVVTFKKDEVERLPIGLSKDELDLKLYEIESRWRLEVKERGIDIIEKKKDITTLEQYKGLYEKFLTEFNEIGQSDLARYIVHRRSVIDLLDQLIELNEDEKFAHEEIIHSLFFPIRETSNSISSDKQNLWLLDERLTFNSLLASDKLFQQVEGLNSTSTERMDIVIKKEEVYENATLYSEDKYPFESFTIVEFKRPERNDYKHGDRVKDPIKQVRAYVEEIIKGKEKIRGKKIEASKRTPFYCYIVADITDSLQSILDYEGFDPTPDGLGYFKFYSTNTSRSYIEVLPFKKVVKDAKQRNKMLFDKLKLS